MMKERPQRRLSAWGLAERLLDRLSQLCDILRKGVRQVTVLGLRPDLFIRIESRSSGCHGRAMILPHPTTTSGCNRVRRSARDDKPQRRVQRDHVSGMDLRGLCVRPRPLTPDVFRSSGSHLAATRLITWASVHTAAEQATNRAAYLIQ